MPQYNGEIEWHVRTHDSIEYSKCSLGKMEVSPHTEYYEGKENPPKYLALWCVNPASCGGGTFSLCDSYPFLDNLTDKENEIIQNESYLFQSEQGLMKLGVGSSAQHKILSLSSSKERIFRFNTTGMNDGNRLFLDSFRDRFLEFYQDTCISFLQEKFSLLIWNNYRMVHSRSSKFSDKTRHLVRFWIN